MIEDRVDNPPIGDSERLRAARSLPARAEQVARVLQIEPIDLVGKLVAQGQPAVKAHAMLDGDTVLALLDGHLPRRAFAVLEPVVRDVFPQGDDGAPRPVTTAVFKNRLIDKTNRDFDETDYGVPTVRAFVRLFPHLLTITEDGRSTFVGLSEPDVVGQEIDVPRLGRRRIRADLWRASLDYASRTTYVWDASAGIARPVEPGEDGLPSFPTMTPEGISAWRREFLETLGTKGLELRDWATSNAKTADLPIQLRSGWNRYQAEKVIAHARESLASVGADGVEVFETASPAATPRVSAVREFMHKYIDVATDEELAALSLNPLVAMRVAG